MLYFTSFSSLAAFWFDASNCLNFTSLRHAYPKVVSAVSRASQSYQYHLRSLQRVVIPVVRGIDHLVSNPIIRWHSKWMWKQSAWWRRYIQVHLSMSNNWSCNQCIHPDNTNQRIVSIFYQSFMGGVAVLLALIILGFGGKVCCYLLLIAFYSSPLLTSSTSKSSTTKWCKMRLRRRLHW